MQIPIQIESDSDISLQDQLFESLRNKIMSNELAPGMLMPSTRALNEQLGVSRNTIVFAYERLIAEGYLHSVKTVGTFVNAQLPDSALFSTVKVATDSDAKKAVRGIAPIDPNIRVQTVFKGRTPALFNPKRKELDIDFWIGRPDSQSFPTNIWRQLSLRHLRNSSDRMTIYHDPCGILEARAAISEHLKPARNIHVDPEQIVITNGIQQGLNLIARLFLKQGSSVVMECPCYQGAAFVMESYGAKLHPIAVDERGMDVRKLPNGKVSLAYITPSHQYPLGATLSSKRREILLSWARKHGVCIAEDDYDSDFRHEGSPLTAVAAQDQSRNVIYMGTFSKSLGAAIRLGYLVVPKNLVPHARAVKALMDNGHSWLDQMVLTDFIDSGEYIKHLRRIRSTYLNRRNCLISELKFRFGNVVLSGEKAGMHLVWNLPDTLPTSLEIEKASMDRGVGVYSLSGAAAHDFGKSSYGKRELLFGYSCTTEEQIKTGVDRIVKAIEACS